MSTKKQLIISVLLISFFLTTIYVVEVASEEEPCRLWMPGQRDECYDNPNEPPGFELVSMISIFVILSAVIIYSIHRRNRRLNLNI